MKRFLMTLFSTLLLSISLFAVEVNSNVETPHELAIEHIAESMSESESSSQPVWDDLYTSFNIEFAPLLLVSVSSQSHFIFFEVEKEIFRPPWQS